MVLRVSFFFVLLPFLQNRRWRTKTIQSMEDHIVKVEGELKALPLAQTELNETDGRLTSEVRHCLNRFFYGVLMRVNGAESRT